jgi:transcriptional regulator with XRE-family HTH domain
MPATALPVISIRIATARKAERMTQRQLATAAAISLSLLRKIEQGTRPATPAVLSSLARAMRSDPAELAGASCLASTRIREAIPLIRHALDCHDLPDDGPVRPLGELRAAAQAVTLDRLACRYVGMSGVLPELLAELTRAAHAQAGRDRQAAYGMLAMAYRAADAIADKHGYTDLSARTIELIGQAATRADDPLLEAMAAYVRAEIFFTGQHPETGLRVLADAAARLDPGSCRDTLAAYGSLHMRAAVLAARASQARTVTSSLAEARDAARHVPDGIYYGTAFGPSSLRVHEVAAAAEHGDYVTVLARAKGWQPPPAVPAERRSHYFIELARAQMWAGQHPRALASLQAARQIAPQHARHNPVVHSTVATLIRVQRHPPGDLLLFARWTGHSACGA